MLYEALAGANPFRAKTPQELADRHAATALSLTADRPDLPPVVLRHIDRALLRDPKKRPSAPRASRRAAARRPRDRARHARGRARARAGRGPREAPAQVAPAPRPGCAPRCRAAGPRLRVVPDPADAAPSLIQRLRGRRLDGRRRRPPRRAGAHRRRRADRRLARVALLGALPVLPGLRAAACSASCSACSRCASRSSPRPPRCCSRSRWPATSRSASCPARAAAVLVWIAVHRARAPRRAWLPALAPSRPSPRCGRSTSWRARRRRALTSGS